MEAGFCGVHHSCKSTQLCGLTGVRLQLAVPPVQYERRIVEAGFCGGFVAQWFMAALVRHPGFESCSCRFFASLLSLSAGWIPIKRSYSIYMMFMMYVSFAEICRAYSNYYMCTHIHINMFNILLVNMLHIIIKCIDVLLCTYVGFGKGINFSKDSKEVFRQAPPDADGCMHVYLCKVMTGDFTNGDRRMKEPPLKDKNRPDRYDSVTNNVKDPTVFVVFKDAQVYPEYHIVYSP